MVFSFIVFVMTAVSVKMSGCRPIVHKEKVGQVVVVQAQPGQARRGGAKYCLAMGNSAKRIEVLIFRLPGTGVELDFKTMSYLSSCLTMTLSILRRSLKAPL